MADNRHPQLELLRSFSPLDGMKKENLHGLSRKAALRELSMGRLLFKEGDTDKRTYYLAKGAIELMRDGRVMLTIRSGTPEARNPLAPQLPRRYSARVLSDKAEYLAMDSDTLDMMLTWDQTGSYHVAELRSADAEAAVPDDWMTTLLQTKAFHRIPPANIQAIFMRMQRVDYKEGETVIKQGDDGDYFYVIVNGKCAVTRETPLNQQGIRLAELGVGDTFGEEALIADAKRNATVTMMTPGTLMRLGKEDFRTLLNEPLLQWVTLAEAQKVIQLGGMWLDVRLPSEFEHDHIQGATNVPLYFLRMKMKSLDRHIRYVVCCDTGRRSSAAAYILSERGFDACVLKDGLGGTDWRNQK
ncbi:MAG TPA: cyclic nucleotide-binding domain-containing protein [Steroidobacteraceae bacterium]|nr:cyclic nucleotide-binding domain-containing protein [Steroidobacteraceae bacterium]